MKKIITVLVFAFLTIHFVEAQAPSKPTSAQIHDQIKKLQVLGSVLYVAAHPDDENTRMIAYMANERKMNTAYLSLTRGDGGQNLIGPEIRELLGVIRTQELLAARRIDGGQQMFTRANDFGYSKSPKETLEIWNEEEVMADVVWAIRKFKPDVIINRFSHDTNRRTHGHHTTSAILSHRAFDMVGKKSVYPEQLEYVDVWQPQRLFFNTSWWFYGSRENFDKADKDDMISVDVGVYYPTKGKSNTEIAAESRSMHKCQGFGSTGTRGSTVEYLQLLKGKMPNKDPFDGINTTWTRVKGGAPIGKLMAEIDKEFNHYAPWESVPKLLKAYEMIQTIEDEHWKNIKTKEIKETIKACMGMYLEGVASEPSATPGQAIDVTFDMINRSKVNAVLKGIELHPNILDSTMAMPMEYNQTYRLTEKITLPNDIATSNPYWLNKNWELGMYTVENQLMRGLPETPRTFKVTYHVEIEGTPMTFETDVVYKRNDPVKGETYSPFEITPPVFANIDEQVYVFADNEPKEVKVLVKAGRANLEGTVELCHGDTWKVEPAKIDFKMKLKGEEQTFTFKLYPPKEQDENFVSPIVRIGEQAYTKEVVFIEYDHIPKQTVARNSESKVVKIDLVKRGQNVAYIMGAGDAIPQSLEQIGYDVTILEDKEITVENLKNYDAVILGIRAYNTVPRLKYHQEKLLQYVEEGGTMIVQYNTSFRMVVDEVGPYPLELSRDRVSVEEAEVRILKPKHIVLNEPNKITEKDFDGWVQERGLYFPNKWSEEYDAILSSNDPGETPKDGGLLVARYGKGYYIYSGYSWFRELPAGVPGAFRLFTNMISINQRP